MAGGGKRRHPGRGSEVRDMVLEAVAERFAVYHAPQPLEMLSDDGSPWTAKETRIFARQLGLEFWFTAVKSAQSEGILKASCAR